MEHLLETYRTDPDAGVHGAAEWTLRQWKQRGEAQGGGCPVEEAQGPGQSPLVC